MQAQNVDAKQLIKQLYKEEEVDKATAEKIFADHKKNGVDIITACLEAGVRTDAVMYCVSRILRPGDDSSVQHRAASANA